MKKNTLITHNFVFSRMQQTREAPELETVETDAFETMELDFYPNGMGQVPLVHDGELLTDERIMAARQRSLNNYREKVEDADMMTKRDKLTRWKNKRNDLSQSLVVTVPESSDKSKSEIVQEYVDADVSHVDDRLLTSVLVADAHPNVTRVKTDSAFIKIYLSDDVLDTDGNFIEASRVGDGVVITGRCRHNGEDVCRAFPDTFIQENEIIRRINKLMDGNEWGLFK